MDGAVDKILNAAAPSSTLLIVWSLFRFLRHLQVSGLIYLIKYHVKHIASKLTIKRSPTYKQDDEDSYGKRAENADEQSDVIQEAIRNDDLQRLERAERSAAEPAILRAAKLIAPRIASSYEDGYEWCIEQVCKTRHLR